MGLAEVLLRAWWRVTLPRRDERGDVPGWVMVAMMTAGLVIAVGAAAQRPLIQTLERALSAVR